MTRTRRRTWQLHAGLTQPHPRLLTTIRMTARLTRKEAHPRPTDRRASTGVAPSATRRDWGRTTAPRQHQDNDCTQSATAVARWTDVAASTTTFHQPHYSTVGVQGGASTTDGQTNVV